MASPQTHAWLEIAKQVDDLLALPGAMERFRERVREAAAEWLRRFDVKQRREAARGEAVKRTGVPHGSGRLPPDPKDGSFHWLWNPHDGSPPLEAWLPAEMSPDQEPDDGFPLPVPATRKVSPAERYAVLAAVYDACWKGNEKICPWVGNDYCRVANAYRQLINTVQPPTELSDSDAVVVQTWIAEVAADFASIQDTSKTKAAVALPSKKRSTTKGEGRAKLIAALTKHHEYADGGCLNLEPIGNNELARLADVNQATASSFFKQQFEGHGKYKAICADAARLTAALKLLNGEFAPHFLYGSKPPTEDERDDE